MGNLFQTSISGMLAAQRSLATTSHNISNVNTEGFSRQRVEYSTRTPQMLGSGYIGTGVSVDTVRRMYDATREAAVQTNTTEFSRLQTYADLSGRLDNLLADETAGLSPAMQNFFDGVQQLADDPSSGTARQGLLTEGENLVSRLNFLDRRFAEIDGDINQRMTVQVGEINEISSAIAQLNKEIVVAQGRNGQPPNDLLDKRDNLVRDLSERIGVRVVEQDDGQYNVFVGNGQILVNAADTNELSIMPSPYDPARPQISVGTGSGGTLDITANLSGGSLGGMLNFRDEVLEPARNDLGRIATSLATAFNEQHRLGANLRGATRGEPFQLTQTTSTAVGGFPSVTEDSATAADLQDSVYEVAYDSGTNAWSMTRLSDGTTYSPSGGTITGGGLQVDVSATPVDSGGNPVDATFQIRPTASLPDDFFDVAEPRVLPRSSNTATGSPEVAIDPDALGELTGSDYRLDYNGSVWSFTRLSDGQSTAVPGSGQLNHDGLSIDTSSISGAQPGDSFLVRPTIGGATDIEVNLQRPEQIAAASGLVGREATNASGGPANTGTAAIGRVRLTGDTGLENFAGQIELTYRPASAGPPALPNRYEVGGSAGYSGYIAYDPATQAAGLEVDLATFGLEGSVELSGAPDAGDQLVIERNSQGLNGDNGNMLELGLLQEDAFLDNGTGTLQETYSGLVGDIGTSTMRAQVNRDAQEVMLNQAVAAREELSGVNLDEEAANLLKFQQAYQASAQAVNIANTLFDSLLQAVRR